MYLPIETMHNILIQWYRNKIEVKTFNFMHRIDILRNSSLNLLGVLQDDFLRVWVPNDAQTPCWLRLWLKGFYSTSAANPADVQERALYFLRQSLCYLILLFYCFLKHILLLWSLPFVLIRQLQRLSWITPIGTTLLHASRHIHNNQTWHWLLASLLIKIITTNNTSKANKKILHLHIARNPWIKASCHLL